MGNRLSAEEREALLKEAVFMRLATINPDGSPHCVPMWFGYIDGQICFKTLQNSVKARNARRDKRVALTVDLGHSYYDLRGLSIRGEAQLVTDPELKKRINDDWVNNYLGRDHPMVEKAKSWSWAYYVVRVQEEFSWDYRKFRPRGER